jgi:predicted phage-related endonuclease
MAAVMFDTHAVIKRLQESGFSEQQAETMTGVLQDTQKTSVEYLATKWDIQDLQRDIKELEANTKRDLKGFEANTKRDLKELEASARRGLRELEASTKRNLKELETNLRRYVREVEITLRRDIDVKLTELKADLLKWTVGLLLAQAAIIATVVKLL